MSRLNLKAVAVGVLVDIAGTVVLIVLLLINQVATGVDVDRVLPDEHFDILGFVEVSIGIGMVTVGAFVAGRFAGRDYLLHGGAIGVVNLFFFLISEPLGLNEDMPLWYLLTSLVGLVPAGVLGGYLAQQLRYRRARRRVNTLEPQ